MLKVWSVSILGGKPKQSPSHTQIIAKHPTCVLALLPKVGTTQIKAAQRPAQCFQCGNQLTKTIACCYHMTSASASINKPLKRSKIQNVDTREQLTSIILLVTAWTKISASLATYCSVLPQNKYRRCVRHSAASIVSNFAGNQLPVQQLLKIESLEIQTKHLINRNL